MLGLLVGALSQVAVLTPLIISLSLVYRVSGVVNFGAGYFVVFTAAVGASVRGLPGTLVALAAGAVVGIAAYYVSIVPARSRGAQPISLTLSTLGFGLLMAALTQHLYGGDPTTINPWLNGTWTIAGTGVAKQQVLIIVAAAAALGLLYALFDRTVMGRTLTAVAYDEELASMYGVRGRRFQLLAWAVAGVCTALAGVFQASVASTSVATGVTLLVYALIGAVVGGLGSLAGSIGGALVVGAAMTAGARYLPGVYIQTTAFLVLFAVLAIRPRGLFSAGVNPNRV
jgi:branched-chain amino acid transport system permease protein